jgi:hypothetical protein
MHADSRSSHSAVAGVTQQNSVWVNSLHPVSALAAGSEANRVSASDSLGYFGFEDLTSWADASPPNTLDKIIAPRDEFMGIVFSADNVPSMVCDDSSGLLVHSSADTLCEDLMRHLIHIKQVTDHSDAAQDTVTPASKTCRKIESYPATVSHDLRRIVESLPRPFMGAKQQKHTAKMLNITVKQVSTFLNNYRKRYYKTNKKTVSYFAGHFRQQLTSLVDGGL